MRDNLRETGLSNNARLLEGDALEDFVSSVMFVGRIGGIACVFRTTAKYSSDK